MPVLRTLLLAVFALLCMPAAARAQHEGTPAGAAAPVGQEPAGHAGGQHADGHEESGATMEMSNDAFFKRQFAHSVPHRIWPPHGEGEEHGPGLFDFYNVNLFQWVALVLMLVLFLPVRASFSGGRAGWFTRVLRGWCLWIRDEMVYAVMGKEEGRVWAPYFVFLFFFIALMNTVGLIPSIPQIHFETATATGTPYVTGALAITTLVLMLVMGMKKNGVAGFWKGLIPHGVPTFLIPILLPIELVSLVVKPFALTIRLFANMLAGHLVIASAIGLVFLFTKMLGGGPLSYAAAIPSVGMAIFVYIIEAFVTLLQAYIFTLLSINFVHGAMHQEH